MSLFKGNVQILGTMAHHKIHKLICSQDSLKKTTSSDQHY